MNSYCVTHVSKDRYGDITAIGAKGRWRLTVDTAIRRIRNGDEAYYVGSPKYADVYVARTPWGTEFLKTTADTTTRNNLDNLPLL
jgi:hypothetical protein